MYKFNDKDDKTHNHYFTNERMILNMKKTISLILSAVLILLCLSSCQVLDLLKGEEENPPTLPEEMPENFSFIVKWNSGGKSNYDSSTGKLVKLGNEDEFGIYIMPQEDLKKVYKLIYDLDILSYEDELDQSKYLHSIPSYDYYLTIKANDIVKSVIALNGSTNYTSAPQKYWKYFHTVYTIIRMLQATDEWKSLPGLKYPIF